MSTGCGLYVYVIPPAESGAAPLNQLDEHSFSKIQQESH